MDSTVPVWCLAPDGPLPTISARLSSIKIPLKPLVLIGSVMIMLFSDMSRCKMPLSMYRERCPLMALRSAVRSSFTELKALSAYSNRGR